MLLPLTLLCFRQFLQNAIELGFGRRLLAIGNDRRQAISNALEICDGPVDLQAVANSMPIALHWIAIAKK